MILVTTANVIMNQDPVLRITGKDRPLFCSALQAIRVHARARMLRNVVLCLSALVLVARSARTDWFAPYAETALSVGSIRAMTLIASLLVCAHAWSSRVRRDDKLDACAERYEWLCEQGEVDHE